MEDLLGPAEKEIVRQLEEGLRNCRKITADVLGFIEEAEKVDWSAIILDPKRKDLAISFLQVTGYVPNTMAEIGMAMKLMAIVAERVEVEASGN